VLTFLVEQRGLTKEFLVGKETKKEG
jgi:hypothetical protein